MKALTIRVYHSNPFHIYFPINYRKFLFDVIANQLKPIEESQPLGLVTSEIVAKGNGNALFTVQDHYGAIMAIPQNTLQLWPKNESAQEGSDIVLLPRQNMVSIVRFYI